MNQPPSSAALPPCWSHPHLGEANAASSTPPRRLCSTPAILEPYPLGNGERCVVHINHKASQQSRPFGATPTREGRILHLPRGSATLPPLRSPKSSASLPPFWSHAHSGKGNVLFSTTPSTQQALRHSRHFGAIPIQETRMLCILHQPADSSARGQL